jgi:5-methylcytosine-specific restriction endonuclease McrA
MKVNKRKTIASRQRKLAWEKTGGRCHFCGKKLVLSAKRGSRGRWNVDHILPLKQGGRNSIDNYLAVCRQCNRLRWHRDSKRIRKLFNYGIIAFAEVCNNTDIGKKLRKQYNAKKRANKERRVRRRGK